MLEASHPIMHNDHKQWLSENGSWLDDVHLWQEEAKDAKNRIVEVSDIFSQHLEQLRMHAAAIRGRELKLREHEHALAEYEQGGEGERLPDLAKTHQAENQHHAQQREFHEQIKRKHHEVVARWNALLKTMKECLEQT